MYERKFSPAAAWYRRLRSHRLWVPGVFSLVAVMLCGGAIAGAWWWAHRPDPVRVGYVIDKDYDPPRDWMESVSDYVYTCIPVTQAVTTYVNGSPVTSYVLGQDCSQRYLGSHLEARHSGPRWRLRLRSDEDPKRTGWVDVDEHTYHDFDAGSHYPDLR